jgi:hypothetical protein
MEVSSQVDTPADLSRYLLGKNPTASLNAVAETKYCPRWESNNFLPNLQIFYSLSWMGFFKH